jgi:BASS family bile acid:Na+ symporter
VEAVGQDVEPKGVVAILVRALRAMGFATGWLLGGLGAGSRRVVALGVAQRNIVAAFVIASQSFDDPKVLVMVIVVATVAAALFP